MVVGVPTEYAAAARRYMGVEQGDAWSAQVAARFPRMARISITPDWVGVLDFETRFPSALA
jgi:pyoverdine/dityrosine biosynthesis protein Dit1